MKYSTIGLIALACSLGGLNVTQTLAQETDADSNDISQNLISNDPKDPGNILEQSAQVELQSSGLIRVDPFGRFRDGFNRMNDALYDRTRIKLGLSFHHLFQGASNVLAGTDDKGTATDNDFVGTWDLVRPGQPERGSLFFGVEGRWDYGTTGPQTIGFSNVAAAGGTANTYSAYTPAYLLRNLYWQQGSKEAGWAFRFGKITTDAIMATNRHISPNATFLPNAGTGIFAAGYPDSGLGFVGAVALSDRVAIKGLISDANGNRRNWGDIGAGDFYTTVELGVKINPRTPKAGYSKFALWHNDGTKDGKGINASTGREGWGYTVVIEQELADDGRPVIVGRYGNSFKESSVYKQQAGLAILLYEPFDPHGNRNDVIGVQFNWIESVVVGTRDEYNIEAFYRFPLSPKVDTTLSYQSVIDPAFTTDFDHSSVYSLRLTTAF